MNRRWRFNWGVGIALTYALFAMATLGFVAFAIGQPVELVSPDYYSQSLAVDRKTEAIQRADALGDGLSIAASESGRAVEIVIPAEQGRAATGTATFYRPSDASADRVIPIAVDARGRQTIDAAALARGRWILKIDWQFQGRRYYREQPLDLR